MALTHYFSFGHQSNGANISKTITKSADAESNIDASIPNGADQLVAFTLDVSQLKGLYIVSDQDVVIETNSSSSAVNVFTMTAGVPFVWVQGSMPALRDTAATAVTVDITALYVTNASGTSATVQIRALIDPTV